MGILLEIIFTKFAASFVIFENLVDLFITQISLVQVCIFVAIWFDKLATPLVILYHKLVRIMHYYRTSK